MGWPGIAVPPGSAHWTPLTALNLLMPWSFSWEYSGNWACFLPSNIQRSETELWATRLDCDVCRKLCLSFKQGIARTQSPTNKNYVLKLLTFGTIVGVNFFQVQWRSLYLGKLPWWSQLSPGPGKYAFHQDWWITYQPAQRQTQHCN